MQILTEAFLQALNMSFTAGIVILCVCLARLALRRAPAVLRYALWAVVLFRLLCPVSFESALALLPTDPAPVGTEILYAAQPEVHTGIAPVDGAVNESLPAAEPAHSANPLQIASAVGAAVWAAGGAGMLLAGGALPPAPSAAPARRARGAEAGVWVAAGLPTAFVLGVVRPRIYLPEGLNDRERGLILAHERAHIRRGDPALRLLAWLALCLHWFNPLVWLAFALSGRDMEAACDEAVLRRLGPAVKRDYSAALLRVATGRRISLAAPLAFGEGGGVKGRIRGVLRWKKPVLWITAALAALVVVLGVGLALNRPQPASYLRAGGALYRKEAATVERLPEGSEAAGLVSSVLHSTDEIPAQEGQATNLDEKYAGCAIYRAGDRAYVEGYAGFYLVFAREAEDLGGAAEEIRRALGLEGAELLLVRQEDAGRLAVFAAGEEVGACLLPSGEDADFAPRPGAGEAAALRLAAFDVLVCGDGGLVRAEREDASGLARVEGSAGAEGPTVFVFPGAADGEAVYRFYDEAGEREDLRLTVLAEDAAAAATDPLVLSAERIEGGAVAWRKEALNAAEQAFLDRIYARSLALSAAWEGLDEAQIAQTDRVCLRLRDGGEAYVYLLNEEIPVLQHGAPGLYTRMTAADFALLRAWADGEENPVVWRAESLYFGQEAGALSALDADAAALAGQLEAAAAGASAPGTPIAQVETAYRFTAAELAGERTALFVYAAQGRGLCPARGGWTARRAGRGPLRGRGGALPRGGGGRGAGGRPGRRRPDGPRGLGPHLPRGRRDDRQRGAGQRPARARRVGGDPPGPAPGRGRDRGRPGRDPRPVRPGRRRRCGELGPGRLDAAGRRALQPAPARAEPGGAGLRLELRLCLRAPVRGRLPRARHGRAAGRHVRDPGGDARRLRRERLWRGWKRPAPHRAAARTASAPSRSRPGPAARRRSASGSTCGSTAIRTAWATRSPPSPGTARPSSSCSRRWSPASPDERGIQNEGGAGRSRPRLPRLLSAKSPAARPACSAARAR